MKLINIIFVFVFVLIILLYSCTAFEGIKRDLGIIKTTNDTIVVDNNTDDQPIIKQINIGSKPFIGPFSLLQFNNDSIVIKPGDKINIVLNIDTLKQTIKTLYDNNSKIYTIFVTDKNKVLEVIMNDVCDFKQVLSINQNIKVIDNYNIIQREKKYKIIMVPWFDEKCELIGYLIRYDFSGRLNKCKNKDTVNAIERQFKKCSEGSNPQPSCPCKLPSNCNCPSWRWFRVCCP